MILDKENLFSEGQAVTATAYSTNYISLGTREIAFGKPIELLINVDTAFATCTSVTFEVETATDAAFTSPISLISSGAIPVASLVAGYRPNLNFMPKGNKGYIRLKYTVTGSNATTGKITSGFVSGVQQSHHNM